MTHRHSSVADLVPLTGPVAALACAACVAVAVLHISRLYWLLRDWPLRDWLLRAPRPDAARRLPPGVAVWMEAGHVLVAAGMAIMFAAPVAVIAAWPFLVAYLALASALLVMLVAHPGCGTPGTWSCCALLVVEAAVMACMSGAAGVSGWPLRIEGALGLWCVILFGATCLAALAGTLARRLAAPPSLQTAGDVLDPSTAGPAMAGLATAGPHPAADCAAAPSGRNTATTTWLPPARAWTARALAALPAPGTPLGSRLIMSGGMVLMLVSRA